MEIILTVADFLGMFLFAKLVMENLHEQSSMAKLLVELANFPTGLDEAYVYRRHLTHTSR